MIYSVNDLEVYKQSLNLLKELYEFLKKIPASEYDTVKNAKRAGKSIPTNISEGFAKRSSEATFKNHLKICIGSSDEVVTHIETMTIILPNLKISGEELMEKYKILSRRLNKLHSIWKSDKF
jgi:four helix bundle protein